VGIWFEVMVIAILLYMAFKLRELTQYVVLKLGDSMWKMHNDRTDQMNKMAKWDFNTKAGVKR